MNDKLPLLYDLAATQHGLVHRADLKALGFERGQVRTLQLCGTLDLIGTQTFRLAGVRMTDLTRVAAACLDASGVASHRTAAWLHGLVPTEPGRPPHVVTQGVGHRYRGPLARVHVTTWLPGDETVLVHGIPCLNVARTLFSLAGGPDRLPSHVLRTLLDDAVRTNQASDSWLWWHLERIRRRGRRGVQGIEDLLVARSNAPTESWLERELLEVIRRAGLPAPMCQARIGAKGAFVARVDFVYECERIVVEALGHAHHSSAAQLAADAARRNKVQLAGFRVLEFTYDDIVARPARVAETIAAALAAAPQPGARSASARP